MAGRINVIRHVIAAIYDLADGLECKSFPVKPGFLYAELRYRYETSQGSFIPSNLVLKKSQ